jgi:hypothetical protein
MIRWLVPLAVAGGHADPCAGHFRGDLVLDGNLLEHEPAYRAVHLVALRAGASLLRLELLEYERRQQRRG